jgi:arylsulfatase A-like enzyme
MKTIFSMLTLALPEEPNPYNKLAMHLTTPTQRLRRSLLHTATLLLLALAAGSPAAAAEPPARKPNFIFIMTDDQSWGDLGCFGHPYAKTPNLDRMAAEGIKFTQYYSCATECAPSRSALITGRIPGKAGKPNNNAKRLDPGLPNFNKLLKSAGYTTGHFGKWHLYDGFKEPPDSERSQYHIDEWKIYGNGNVQSKIVDATLDFLGRHKDAPFHVSIWFTWPHLGGTPDAKQLAVYNDVLDPAVPGKQVDITRFHPTMQAKFNQIKQLNPKYNLTGKMREYLAAVTDMDTQIGRVLTKLDELHLSQNTLVVFAGGDQGANATITAQKPVEGSDTRMWAANAGPYRGGKFSYLEGNLRMSCLAQWKGRIKGGQVNDSLWRSVDWLPTVCALAGVKTDDIALDGQNVSDIVLGAQRERSEPIFWQGAVREGNWKLVKGELYNLKTDPSEQNNLASKYPERAQQMKTLLQEWLKK